MEQEAKGTEDLTFGAALGKRALNPCVTSPFWAAQLLPIDAFPPLGKPTRHTYKTKHTRKPSPLTPPRRESRFVRARTLTAAVPVHMSDRRQYGTDSAMDLLCPPNRCPMTSSPPTAYPIPSSAISSYTLLKRLPKQMRSLTQSTLPTYQATRWRHLNKLQRSTCLNEEQALQAYSKWWPQHIFPKDAASLSADWFFY